jgi:hypothetical protein
MGSISVDKCKRDLRVRHGLLDLITVELISLQVFKECFATFNSGTHEIFPPWNAYAGTGSSLLSGPLAPSCGSMKVENFLAKSFSNIFLSVEKNFNPTILLVPDEKHDFSKLVKFGY